MSSIAATPTFTPAVDAIVSRRLMFLEYLETLNARGDFARWFADDITFNVVGGPEAKGRPATEATMRAIHEQMFDSHLRVHGTVCEMSRAVAELTFVGTHVADFMGIPATGRRVEVPYTAICDIADDGRFTALRVYFPMHILMAQLDATD